MLGLAGPPRTRSVIARRLAEVGGEVAQEGVDGRAVAEDEARQEAEDRGAAAKHLRRERRGRWLRTITYREPPPRTGYRRGHGGFGEREALHRQRARGGRAR